MSGDDDFASLMQEASGPARRRLRRGDSVEGAVIAITQDSVFLDVGSAEDARVDRAECVDASGKLTVSVGDRLRGVVVETGGQEGPRVSIAVGRAPIDVSALESARESKVAVEGIVKAANKGGLEITVGGVRAFCPASQVDIGRVLDLEAYVGQTLSFQVIEVRDDGSVVLSRRKALEDERAADGQRRLESMKVGDELDGTVSAVQRYGAFVDIGGVQGLVHISELSSQRVERVEDAVRVGEAVRVRVVGIEETDKGPRVRLSMRAPGQAPEPTAAPGEVLDAEVIELLPHGLRLKTSAGEGLLRVRDMILSPGADHRRAYPVGSKLRVVVDQRDPRTGRLTFSMSRVAAAEERKNVAEYAQRNAAPTDQRMGTLGALLAKKLGLPEPSPASAPVPDRDASSDRTERQAANRRAPDESPGAISKGTTPAQPAGVVRRRKPR